MLQAYKDGATTEQVFRSVLNTDLKSFDTKFFDYMRARFAGVLPSIGKRATSITRQSSVADIEAELAKSPNDFGTLLLGGAGLRVAHAGEAEQQLLGERRREDGRQDDRRRDERPRPRAAPDLVHPGDGAVTFLRQAYWCVSECDPPRR